MDSGVSIAVDMEFGSARPTLNDILFQHNLEREHLHKECPPDVRLMIAKRVSEWTLVGRYLGISKQDLTAISSQYDTEEQRKVAMFDTWHDREGSNATYLRLADALYQYGREDLIQWLCLIVMFETLEESGNIAVARIVPESKSESTFRSNLDKIKSRFAFLTMKVRSALEANNVDPIDVHGVLIKIFDCGDCLPKTNLEEMFTAVTSQRLWDYTHHSPVEELLRHFLPDRLSLMQKYKAQLSRFLTTSKLIDYITYTNVDPTVDNKLDLEKLTDANYQKLKVIPELDRRIDTVGLKYVQELWEEFAEKFNLPYPTAVIGKIFTGRCLHITWLITPDTANKIATAAREHTFFQNHPSIIYVAINDTVHYNEVNSNLYTCIMPIKMLQECIAYYEPPIIFIIMNGVNEYHLLKHIRHIVQLLDHGLLPNVPFRHLIHI